ncbi:HNH endonuclease [Chloroflexota bacterium]
MYAFLADWWKENAILGWIILGILLTAAVFFLYRFASLRGWLGRQAKDTVKKVVFEKVASSREPLPKGTRDEVLKRAHSQCENERCNFKGRPHIHHIDANNSHNPLSNLIALCPNCHQKAHDGVFTESQLINLVRRDYRQLRAGRARG